jgi:hypothetical protein
MVNIARIFKRRIDWPVKTELAKEGIVGNR